MKSGDWSLLFHRCVLEQLERLKAASDKAIANSPQNALENANVKLYAAFARHAPAVAAGLAKIGAALAARQPLARALRKTYPGLPKVAVDYAILEKADNVVVLPATFDLDDVGSWTAISRHSAKDAAGNVILGRAIVEEGHHNIVITDDRHFTAVLGADHLIIVHTPDATLVCTREKAGHLKSLLNRLQADPHGRKLL